MNERIKQLYVNALSEAGDDGEEAMVEKFAELIAADMAAYTRELEVKIQELEKQGEPVAWRVTGPFEDIPFKDRSSAEAYRKGLNDGYGSDAYSVSPLYTAPPSVESME